MTKGGRLSLVEKAAIQGMLGQQKSTEEIASLLDRSEKVVENYIDGELDDLHSNIANAQIESQEREESKRYSKARKKDIYNIREAKKSEIDSVTDEGTVAVAKRRLGQAGLKDTDIAKVIDLAINKFAKIGKRFKDDNELYTECIRQMKAGEFMIKKSQGGRDGVAIMTPAASQRTDDSSKSRRSASTRYTSENIFRPNG